MSHCYSQRRKSEESKEIRVMWKSRRIAQDMDWIFSTKYWNSANFGCVDGLYLFLTKNFCIENSSFQHDFALFRNFRNPEYFWSTFAVPYSLPRYQVLAEFDLCRGLHCIFCLQPFLLLRAVHIVLCLIGLQGASTAKVILRPNMCIEAFPVNLWPKIVRTWRQYHIFGKVF